ncbi:metallopeptidase family protein [Acaricomes phytoseiuli]|uniref:metallopeptidase family protein n=1 Tax=Acaricomes phytoseiuli TaxID=291968 RepID=UPI00035CE6A5|nr:metallopeptidase family protein [Acaricomes phytoseiuli]
MKDPLAGMPHFGRYEMSLAEFEQATDEAVAQLPPELAEAMNNVAIVIEERYAPGPDEDPGLVLLGLYQGVPLTERTEWSDAGTLPDKISIYRQPIMDLGYNRDEIVAQIRITVIHEIAHHFGIDDDRLHELGWA